MMPAAQHALHSNTLAPSSVKTGGVGQDVSSGSCAGSLMRLRLVKKRGCHMSITVVGKSPAILSFLKNYLQ